GIASGLVTSNQQIGGAIGIAVMVTLSTTVMNDRLAAGAQQISAMLDGFSTAFTVQTILMSCAILVAGLLAVFGREAARIEGQPVLA
ncbi:MAG: MFS transporter, partial [Actinobacteria bacterium]|nr:MFS transporter [Actinomycetota bacterium]